MGGPSFDRQVFVKKQPKEKPPSRSLLPGAFVLLLVAGLAAFGTYRYVKAGGKVTSNPADTAKIKELQTKLKKSQARVQALEKKRHASRTKHHATEAKPAAAKTPADAPQPAAAKVTSHPTNPMNDNTSHSTTDVAKSMARKRADATTGSEKPSAPSHMVDQLKAQLASNQATSNKKLAALQNDLTANHENWQATTNRLGSVVGQVDSQQTAIQKNQTSVNYLLERVHRNDVSFTLKKGAGLERVGPISMKLLSTNVKGQHYNIRMIVDDKSVELKDRALNEVVEFYTSQSKYPLRLIISQIDKGQVAGTLAVPYELGRRADNPQHHELEQRQR